MVFFLLIFHGTEIQRSRFAVHSNTGKGAITARKCMEEDGNIFQALDLSVPSD